MPLDACSPNHVRHGLTMMLACCAVPVFLLASAPAHTAGLQSRTAPAGLFHIALAYDGARGRTVLFGGASAEGMVADTWEWDGVTWTQVSTTGPEPRDHHAAAYDAARGMVLVFGGGRSAGGSGALGDLWGWNGKTWTRLSEDGPPARGGVPAMAYDTKRRVTIMMGGGTSAGRLEDLWEWDGRKWSRRL